ncbi:MAG: outer membrane beta-barrel protein [Bacteroidota bacterium]
MKAPILSLLILCCCSYFLSAQKVQVAFSAKGNWAMTNLAFTSPSDITGNPDFFLRSNLDPGTSSPRLGFELGVDARLHLKDFLYLTSGLYFQQIQYEVVQPILFNPSIDPLAFSPIDILEVLESPGEVVLSSSFVSERRLQYLKLPIGLGANLFKDRFFIQGGLYGALLLNSSETLKNDLGRINPDGGPIFFTDANGDLISQTNQKSKPFNNLVMGLQVIAQYNIFSKLSVLVAYERNLNDILGQSEIVEETMNTVSFGFGWQIN